MDISLLEKQAFWPHLTPSEQQRIRDHVLSSHFSAGEAIKLGGNNCIGPLFVVHGILRVYLLSADGREATIYRLRQGDACMLSASCMLSAITFDVQIDAETDCDLLIIPTTLFADLMSHNLYERLSDLIQAVERMFFLTLRQRIAAFLIDESATNGTDRLTLTQEQLARAIGSAREAVSRSLKQLAQSGSIEVSRGGIRILNKSLLYAELEQA